MVKEVLGFEDLVGSKDFDSVADGYGHFHWQDFGVVGEKWLNNNYPVANGYDNAIRGKAIGYTADLGGFCDSTMDAIGRTFTLKSGTFAAAWNSNETVTFKALVGDVVVGTKTIKLDQAPVTITFSKKFQHVDAVEIVTSGGHDASPDDGFFGPQVALENLNIILDPRASAHDSAHHFGVLHSAVDWFLA